MEATPLPWYIAGPLIGLAVPLLLLLVEKPFGLSTSYDAVIQQFKSFSWPKAAEHQLFFGAGVIAIAFLLSIIHPIDYLSVEGLTAIYGPDAYLHYGALFGGGILVGFGSRYAKGCTAGHCIMGVSQGSVPSMISTMAFFAGGWIASQFIVPLLF